jgi:hypothetical protein
LIVLHGLAAFLTVLKKSMANHVVADALIGWFLSMRIPGYLVTGSSGQKIQVCAQMRLRYMLLVELNIAPVGGGRGTPKAFSQLQFFWGHFQLQRTARYIQ